MQVAQISLDSSGDEPPADFTMGETKPLAYQKRDSLSEISDEELRRYEDCCFHHFEAATTKAEQHDCVHEMARCIVEMTNRGMPLNGGK